MKRILFLDLENTLIDSWGNWYLCSNWERIKQRIKELNPDEVHVFSYAIWNETDKQYFDVSKVRLEKDYDIKFAEETLSVEDIKKVCKDQLRVEMDKETACRLS